MSRSQSRQGNRSRKSPPEEGSRAELCLPSSPRKRPRIGKLAKDSLHVNAKSAEGVRSHTSFSFVLFCGSVSTGLIHATPGEIKSLRSSADRIALILPWRRFRSLSEEDPAEEYSPGGTEKKDFVMCKQRARFRGNYHARI